MVNLNELVTYSNDLLEIEQFSDYCPNGLQVAGCDNINTLVTGVTANMGLIDAAIEHHADALLVHHGYFWRGEDPVITGMKYRRICALIHSNITLLAYHLPLDAHPLYGNNAQLAEKLGFSIDGKVAENGNVALLYYGKPERPMSAAELAEHLAQQLQRAPLLIEGGKHKINTVGWCSGAAQHYIEHAVQLGLDAFISGEVSEKTVHIARECGVHYYSAGHHATERYGVYAFGKHLAQQFNLIHHHVDIDNPV